MKILGLDIATKTGWCLMEDMKILESGVEDFTIKRGESPGMKFLRFRHWLDQLFHITMPKVIFYEQAHYRGGAATECCVGLITRVHEKAAEMGINYQGVHSSTLKKFIAGHGKADKKVIMGIIEQKFSIKVIDDNHADAIAICLYAESEVGKL